MATLYPSRSVNNSNGRCLLENWVEERQVQDMAIEEEGGGGGDKRASTTSNSTRFKDGHPGILTTAPEADPEKISTFKHSYREPPKLGVRTVGSKKELLEKMLYEKVSQEVHEEFNPPPPEVDFCSVTKKDFDVEGFTHELPAPQHAHNLETEQPITFWSSHKDKIHGVSQQKTYNKPFRKNAKFSTPIEEQWDESKPYELETHPNLPLP